MKTLIVGMGFGNLYKSVHTDLGNDIVTVDTNGKADYANIDDAIRENSAFDVAHICTPNFTHIKIARKIAPACDIVIIEKPGSANADAWEQLVKDYPSTRFMMSKNNMWRSNIQEMHHYAQHANLIRINWINKDRVPNPGTWFTTKSLAYGGVSRDLMPHLLSLYIALNPFWKKDGCTHRSMEQVWSLDQLTKSDYGTVDPNGTYDVDDVCQINFTDKWMLTANWRNLIEDRRNIEFVMPGDRMTTFELGLCPESAYKAMVQDALSNRDNDEFWSNQYKQDLWIHATIDKLCE
jgi:predicted dehydrogenase